jgi:hypothetical protein
MAGTKANWLKTIPATMTGSVNTLVATGTAYRGTISCDPQTLPTVFYIYYAYCQNNRKKNCVWYWASHQRRPVTPTVNNIVETFGSSPRSSEILQKILETEIRGETLIIDRPWPLATRRVSWTFIAQHIFIDETCLGMTTIITEVGRSIKLHFPM